MSRPSAMRASVTRMSRYSQGALVNSGCESSRSMIRRSGVTSASNWSNSGRGTLRRCANGQMPSRQLRKFAAAARMAVGAHQRMTGGAVFAGPFARRLAERRAGGGRRLGIAGVRRREQRADVETLREPHACAARDAEPRPQIQAISAISLIFTIRPLCGRASQLLRRLPCYMVARPLRHNPPAISAAARSRFGVEPTA